MIPKIALILGTTYTGKSWAAGHLAATINRPFVVIVHTHRDRSYLYHFMHRKARFVAVTPESYTVTADFLYHTRTHYRYLYLSVYDLSPEQVRYFLSSLATAVKESGDLALFIDEAHLFCSRFQVPSDVIGFIRGARHYGTDVFLVTHRLKDIDVGIRCVLTQLILFRTTEQTDIDVLADELGMGKEAAENVRLLPDRKHLFVDRRTGYISPESEI